MNCDSPHIQEVKLAVLGAVRLAVLQHTDGVDRCHDISRVALDLAKRCGPGALPAFIAAAVQLIRYEMSRAHRSCDLEAVILERELHILTAAHRPPGKADL